MTGVGIPGRYGLQQDSIDKVSHIQFHDDALGRSPSIDHANPDNEIGQSVPISKEGIDVSGKKEGITLGKVGNFLLRALAGTVGGPLYAAAFLVSGGVNLAVFVTALLMTIPPLAQLGGIGYGIGLLVGNKEMGVGIASAAAAALPATGGILALSALMLPNALIYNTAGRLGAGLCAFAATGKTEDQQLEGDRFRIIGNVRPGSESYNEREKSTNKKLLDALFLASFPMLGLANLENIISKTKKG